MGNVVKIALTGGPCGGKTEALIYLRSELEKLGVRVFTLEETATSLMEDGITPKSAGSFEFHSRLFEKQYNKEKELDLYLALFLCFLNIYDIISNMLKKPINQYLLI